MIDVQGQPDTRGVPIDVVGVRNLQLPIRVELGAITQSTVADASLSAALPAEQRGAHLSRLVEVAHEDLDEVGFDRLVLATERLRDRLAAVTAEVELRFPIFLERRAPVTDAKARAAYDCRLRCRLERSDGQLTVAVTVPVTTVCPCSKEISDYGAHNQRCLVDVVVDLLLPGSTAAVVSPEELVELVEGIASAPVFPIVKRPDERYLTMLAYDNPVFVEDVAREASLTLRAWPGVVSHDVLVRSEESIHGHDAFASISWERVREEPDNLTRVDVAAARSRS